MDVAAFRLTVTRTVEDAPGAGARIDGQSAPLSTLSIRVRKTTTFADSELLGFVDFDVAQRSIQRLRIATTKATYAGTDFRASLVSMSRENAGRAG